MSISKSTIVSVGNGNNPVHSARLFCSQSQITVWNPLSSYNLYDYVEYNGIVYRSKTSNINVLPDLSESDFEAMFAVHDGDICVSLQARDIQQRMHGIWLSVSGRPIVVDLIDGQITPADIFSYSASDFRTATIAYEVSRTDGRVTTGLIDIVTDGITEMSWSEEFLPLGEVACAVTPILNAGVVTLQYVSADESVPIIFKYSLKGW